MAAERDTIAPPPDQELAYGTSLETAACSDSANAPVEIDTLLRRLLHNLLRALGAMHV